jgi:hypothetical protein
MQQHEHEHEHDGKGSPRSSSGTEMTEPLTAA